MNRVIGVIIGLLISLTFIFSLKYKNSITLFSGIAFVLVVFQGWLGSFVVSTNLLPGLITLHMIVALLIVVLLVAAYYKSIPKGHTTVSSSYADYVRYLLYTMFLISFAQIIIGTQVREEIDIIARSFQHSERHLWISSLGNLFPLHIALSVLLFAGHLLMYLLVKKVLPHYSALFGALFIVIFLEIVFGAILGIFNLPAFAQPFHLLFGTLIIGGQFYLILLSREVSLHKYA